MADRVHERQFDVEFGEFEFRAADDGDGLTVAGYIAKFNERTVIQDWDGEYVEDIKRGAFTNTRAERGAARIKMQFNHGHDSTFGALPIGVWTDMREDRKGLFGEGRIHDNWHTVPIRHAIESGALDGMSFKFKVIASTERKSTKPGELDHRTLTEVALFEAGVVVHPAYEGTTVGIRSALDLYRAAVATSTVVPAIVTSTDTAAVPVDGTDPETRTVADPPVGITRQQMSDRVRVALALQRAIPNDQDRVA
jgi:hypothetical protein